MNTNLSQTNHGILIFDTGLYGSSPRQDKPSLYHLCINLLKILREEIQHDIVALGNMKILHNLAYLIDFYIAHEDCDVDILIGSIKNIDLPTTDFLLCSFRDPMTYQNNNNIQKVSFEHHTSFELNVLKEFVLLALQQDNFKEWGAQEIDWVQEWDTICEQWQPSFGIGGLIQIPEILTIPGLTIQALPNTEEIELMVNI